MKLIDLKCSNCGADMKANTELKKVVCNYCGKEMLVDDEIKKMEMVNGFQYGYEQEQGRIKAREEYEKQQEIQKFQKEFKSTIIKGVVIFIVIIAVFIFIVVGFNSLR